MDDKARTHTGTSWRCRIRLHDYLRKTTDDGTTYLVCSRCGREDFPGSSFNMMPNG